MVIFIEINFEFVPNRSHKTVLFFRDSSGNRLSLHFGYSFGEFDVVSQISSDEVDKLLEGDEAVFVSVEFVEDEDEIFSGRFEPDEEAAFVDEEDELFERDLFGVPDFTVG